MAEKIVVDNNHADDNVPQKKNKTDFPKNRGNFGGKQPGNNPSFQRKNYKKCKKQRNQKIMRDPGTTFMYDPNTSSRIKMLF